MTLSDRAGTSEYQRLRAEYDVAFATLRAAAQQHSAHNPAEEAAMDRYRECRARLANYLATSGVAAAGPGEVEALAYRLWEEAGRPSGRPQEYWYRAERLIRRSSAS